jgi:hypothetical protein
MFEKEAEEYANRKCGTIQDNEWKFCKLDWQQGAEFGYNKAFVEADKNLKAVVADFNKANEWQFVSEKGLPKESGRYLVYVGGGENGVYPLDFDTEANDFGYWCLQVGASLGVTDTVFETVTERNEDKVIAWKEIVPPEL